MGSMVVSLSNGKLALLKPSPENGLQVSDTWHAHDYEPWTVAWNYWDTNVIYSGGDDLKLKVWDIRSGFDQPVQTNKRFDAGVTSLMSHPNVEHIFAAGSYDSTVRLFDCRKLLTPLTQADVGGGAWRVKWHPSPNRQHDLLVACMHDGFKVVSFWDLWKPMEQEAREEWGGQRQPPTGEKWEINMRFEKHESLAYGVDWSYDERNVPPETEGVEDDSQWRTLVGSASFYDHTLYVWRG